jgi:hypothetical protein
MAVVEIVRSFAVAMFPGATLVLNLATGTFFHVDVEATLVLLAVARGAPVDEVEQQMAELCKSPRYAARERVRALQLQLRSPFALASNQGSFARILGAVRIGEQPGTLRDGPELTLHGATLRSSEGIHLLVGPRGSGKSLLCNTLKQHRFRIVEDGAVTLRSRKRRIDVSVATAWFLEAKRSSGLGLTLAACTPTFVATQLLDHTSSMHPRGAWVEIFQLYAELAMTVPAFRVTLPHGVIEVQEAVSGFAEALRLRAPEPRGR